MTNPVFILSLPRSGSTLLQRMLAVHPEIATSPEPWILLPLAYVIKGNGAYSEYGQTLCVKATDGFCRRLPEGMDDYRTAIRLFADHLYQAAGQDSRYFVDKTPRYHLIATELLDIFPDAKFIFLYRNPMAILSSIISTWQYPHIFRVDLYAGLDSLLTAASSSVETACFVKYEDLVAEPEKQISRACEYLDVDPQPSMWSDFGRIEIPVGEFGNPRRRNGSSLEDDSVIGTSRLDAWKAELSMNPIRRALALRYLKWIGQSRLERMGYSMEEIWESLRAAPVGLRDVSTDVAGCIRGIISVTFETHIARDKLAKVPAFNMMYTHR